LSTSTQLPPEVRNVLTDVIEEGASPEPPRRRGRRGRRRVVEDSGDRGILSISDRRKPGVRWSTRVVHGVLLVVLIVVGLGPLLWLAKSAITPTVDTLQTPMALFPHGVDWATSPRRGRPSTSMCSSSTRSGWPPAPGLRRSSWRPLPGTR